MGSASRSDGKTRADKKFEKKMQFYESVRDAVSQKTISKEKQQKKRSRQKKLNKAFDLSALSKYLPELKQSNEKSNGEFKLNNKRRNVLVIKESNVMKTVTEHPDFQSDPLGSLYKYLLNTQPPSDQKIRRRKDNKRKKNKKKNKKNKSESTQAAMEI